MITAVIFFAVGFLVALLTTPWVIRLSEKGIGLDRPHEARKNHTVPIPRLGGAPIMLATSISLLIIFTIDPSRSSSWFPILLGSLLMYGLGLWDDLRPLGARVKLIGQITTACIVYALGLSISRVSYPGGGWSVELGHWSFPVTILWLIAVPNIINLIDGFDGLAGGLGMFLATTLGIVAIYNEQLAVAWYAFAMAGALLGFLVFNFPPAKIFLGDGGAYLIGFTIAALSLTSSNKASVAAVLLVTVVALGLPILDTALAILRRASRGFSVFHPDGEHIHHKLQGFGFSRRRILFGMYGLCVVLSLLGLSIVWSQGRTLPIGIAAFCLMAVAALRYFHFLRNWGDIVRKVDRLMGERRLVQFALLQAQVLQHELDRCRSSDEFWRVFDHTLRRVGFVQPDPDLPTLRVEVKYNGGAPWTLHRPRNGEGSEAFQPEWQRIAECFKPVYVRAKSKWET